MGFFFVAHELIKNAIITEKKKGEEEEYQVITSNFFLRAAARAKVEASDQEHTESEKGVEEQRPVSEERVHPSFPRIRGVRSVVEEKNKDFWREREKRLKRLKFVP